MLMYTCICVKLTIPVAPTSSNDLLKAFNAPAGKLTKLTLTKHQAVTAHLTGSCQTTCYNLHPLTQGDLKLSTSESRLHSLQLCNAHMIMMLAKITQSGAVGNIQQGGRGGNFQSASSDMLQTRFVDRLPT